MSNAVTMPANYEKSTAPVGHATRDALRIGDSLTAWARNDRARRAREAARVAELAELERAL